VPFDIMPLSTTDCVGASSGPVLLYDGTCGLCSDSVQFVLTHDRGRTLRFAALDSAFGRDVLRRHPEIVHIDSVVWVVPATDGSAETVTTQSAAALQVAAYLGGCWRAATIAQAIPSPLRDAVYRFVARHRHQFRRGGQECFVPSPEERARFLA
jgi:predicted DCC family thiol-disulfide oxidoreductase YuxK